MAFYPGVAMKCFLLFLALSIVFPSIISAQEEAPVKTITLEEFFQKVRTSHPFFSKEALSAKIERIKQEKYLGGQDWVVRSSPYFAHQQSANESPFAPKEIDQVGGMLSFSYDYTSSDTQPLVVLLAIPFGMVGVIAQGTSDRLRAIIMTTLTTVAGLLPLAYGIGGSDIYMGPMALALGYGILFATPLTQGLIPCLYMVGDDIRRIFQPKPKQA